ncbi:dNA primase [Firmicutes bacterium CAG:475]|nr:dNA primase [Firmicutes bacterium CAG:475]
MAGGFTPEFLEELKYKCDIVEVISQYVPLQKKGGRYFGCCPFHNEKTPSFCVNNGWYHCFGCGATGDVVKFVMEMESVSFYDAVKLLADKVGMQLPEVKLDPEYAKKKEHSDVLKQLMRDAARYYRNNLLDENKGKEAREYLHNRSLDDETAKRYGLGLSLDGESMVGYMRRKGYLLKDLEECGLVGNAQRPYDAFANRIIVPIMDSMSNVIAFGGRIYHGEKDVAKYKNSTNTTLFDKGRTIYGINFIKRDKKMNGVAYKELILVEGYMDVISLGASGIKNAVACMGTALTDGQARELSRMTENLYVCYDGDGAGKKATIRNVDILAKFVQNVRVISLDDGKDPDETVREGGAEAFLKKQKEALPVIEYKLKLCADANDLGSVNGRAKYVQSALKVLKTIDNRAEREVYMDVVSKMSGVSVATLTDEVGMIRPTKIERTKENDEEKIEKTLIASRFVLNRILKGEKFVDISKIKTEWLANDLHKEVFDWAKTMPEHTDLVNPMFSKFGYENDEINKILNVNMKFADTIREADYFNDCVLMLANEFVSKRLEQVKNGYNELSDPEAKRASIAEISRLQKILKSKDINDKL